MRSRSLLVLALFSLPVGLGAQGIRLPRGTRGTQPATLPPEIPVVARALAVKRSRWSAEGYSLFSAIQVPSGSGSASYAAAGAGTRADYRFAEHFSATLDVTASFFGGFANTQTGEVGTRFVPTTQAAIVRPYFDLRAVYTHANDTYVVPGNFDQPLGGPNQRITSTTGQYSGGLGGLAGAGMEYSLTNSFALTTELSAMRTRMNSYRLTGNSDLQGRTNYWMTAYRFTFGLKYNRVQALHLAQNPMR